MKQRAELHEAEKATVADRVGPATRPTGASEVPDLDPASARGRNHWVYTPEERCRIVSSLLVADGSPWIGRFGFLLAMSVIIATLGLANNQPAAVIAAMVVAPMMTPVLGIATATVLGLTHQARRLLVLVVVASLVPTSTRANTC